MPRGLLSLLLLGALFVPWTITGCDSSDSAPDGAAAPGAHLYQVSAGAEPAIRTGWSSNIPDPSLVVAWLVYRAEFYGFPAEHGYLIDVRGQQTLSDYSDFRGGTGLVALNYSLPFTYTRNGQQQSGSIDASYARPDLVAGRTYYYRARRVVRPNSGAPPLTGSAQASALTVDPFDALSQPSDPAGPVTYIVPATPTSPTDGLQTADPAAMTFTWTIGAGADEYQIRVYDNASVAGNPVMISPVIRPAGTTGSYTYAPGGSGLLRATTTYYWTVGSRKLGEAPPTCAGESGWLKSQVRQFRTTEYPPGTP